MRMPGLPCPPVTNLELSGCISIQNIGSPGKTNENNTRMNKVENSNL